jgi:hypothetical protein
VNFVDISAPIFLGTCNASGNPNLGTRSVKVIQGTETSEFLKFQELAQIQGAAVCQVNVAAIPDGWLIRPEWHKFNHPLRRDIQKALMMLRFGSSMQNQKTKTYYFTIILILERLIIGAGESAVNQYFFLGG